MWEIIVYWKVCLFYFIFVALLGTFYLILLIFLTICLLKNFLLVISIKCFKKYFCLWVFSFQLFRKLYNLFLPSLGCESLAEERSSSIEVKVEDGKLYYDKKWYIKFFSFPNEYTIFAWWNIICIKNMNFHIIWSRIGMILINCCDFY